MRWNMQYAALTILSLATVFGCGGRADSVSTPAVVSTAAALQTVESLAVVSSRPEPAIEPAEVSTKPTDPIPAIAVDEPVPVKPIEVDVPIPEPSTSSAVAQLIDLQKFPRINA